MLQNIVLLLSVALPLMGSPGPASMSLAATGSTFGFQRGGRYLIGILLGNSTVFLMIAGGVTGLLLTIQNAVPVLTVLGLGYLLYLAFKIATDPFVGRLCFVRIYSGKLDAGSYVLNSRSGTIIFFPCVPSEFNVAFRGFQARGGFGVSAEWRDGRVTHAEITARRDGRCAVKNPWPDRPLCILELPGETAVALTTTQNTHHFAARAGTTYVLPPGLE